jgi:hypothetical protein
LASALPRSSGFPFQWFWIEVFSFLQILNTIAAIYAPGSTGAMAGFIPRASKF